LRSALVAAARRFLALLLLVGSGIAVVSIVLGMALGERAQRSLAVGLYLGGSFMMIAGFFVGNRGPARPTEGSSVVPFIGARMLRWATAEERDETINDSAIFVSLGLVLLVLGAMADSHHRLS
jgi:peptidoglycan/LPS O-acetylase OafA/YrhL